MANPTIPAIQLTGIVSRLAEQKERPNSIAYFDKAAVVKKTHADLVQDVHAACSRLLSWGVKPGMLVGIRAPNCYEWIVYDLALIELRVPSIAFTDDFAATRNEELINRYDLSLLLVNALDDRGQTKAVALLRGENRGVQAIDKGRLPDADFTVPGYVFSSGSSGYLKGLILNRKGIEVSIDAFTRAVSPRQQDCLLLFLPISNFQQRLMYYAALWYGFDLIVTDPAHLFRALKDLHPTILIAPPLFYETIESRFYSAPRWKQITARAIGSIFSLTWPDKLRKTLAKALYQEVHDALGGRMRFMITGMAPIRESTLRLMRQMQLPLYETYGLTEFGSISLNLPAACKLLSVGRPLPGVNVEIASDGEIVVHREHTIARGYFECGEREAEQTFLTGNRIATGDIGRIDRDGFLHLIGRKKEMILTSSGEKIHPEVIESRITSLPEVARAVVFQCLDKPFLTAVVLPRTPDDVSIQVRIREAVDGLNRDRRSTNIGEVIFTDQPFSRENGFLRSNLKLDRKRIVSHFQSCA